ncbi:MAG: hypothetical protein M1821_005331 [Bathelium mastoideum]|nr:MAG: hypothetical protein M1821_005331 [Bathelium mastoideum]
MLDATSQQPQAQVGSVALSDGFLLDFLYPPKTKAFLRDLTSKNGEKLERHRGRQSHLNRYREYSSAAGVEGQSANLKSEIVLETTGHGQHPPDDSYSDTRPHNPLHSGYENVGDRATVRPVRDAALESLQTLLGSGQQGSYEEGWRMVITADSRSPEYGKALADFIEYLSISHEKVNAERIVQLFSKLGKQFRRPSSYRAALAAYLKLQDLGAATMIFRQAAQIGIVENVGVEVLLEQIVVHQFWHLGSEVYRTCCMKVDSRHDQDNIDPWERIRVNNIPLNTIMSLAENVRQFPQCFNEESNPAFVDFFRDLSMIVLEQQLNKLFISVRQSHQRQVDQVLKLVSCLRSLNATNAEFYHDAIFKLHRRHKNVTPEKGNLMISLYEMFRKEKFFSPSQPLFKVIMSTLCHHESRDEVLRHFTSIEDVAKDWVRCYGFLSNDVVRTMLETFSRAGKVALVHKYFGYLENPSEKDLQQSFFWLIYVHTRRADLNRATWQFERMTQEFSIQPNCECYNALLQAHARNDDLEGALRRFEEMETDRMTPDTHTFGILMGMYASRGDPQGVSELFSVAKNHGITPTPHMWATLVRAHVGNDDMASAENVAEKCTRTQTATESMTVVWNQVLTAHALRRDLDATSRVFELMRNRRVPTDGLTYAALMQCLVLLRQCDAARKILQKVVPKERVQRLALHYAIVMGGYVETKQWSRVLGLDAAMRQRGIRPTVSTRIPVLRARIAVETQFGRERGQEDIRARLMTTEQALLDALETGDRREVTSTIRQPGYGLQGFSMHESYPDAFYEVLLSSYGRKSAFDIIDDIFEEYLRAKELPAPSSFIPPLKFLTALMQSHWRAGEHDEIEKCWLLVYRKAMRYVKVFPVPRQTLSMTPTEMDTHQRVRLPARMASARRHIISGPFMYLVRSLSERGETSRLTDLVGELTDSGWILTNQVWNLYVRALANNAHALSAFEVCERRLMPGWPGWRSGKALLGLSPRSHRKAGFKWMAVHTVLPEMLLPQYSTMVTLARTLLEVQRSSAYASDGSVSMAGIRRHAPKTVKAIEAMPLLEHDNVQRALLRT